MKSELSNREKELLAAMRSQGYRCVPEGDGFRLVEIRINGYSITSNPQWFKSIQSMADYLCPIVKDADFTKLVSA